MVAFLGWGGESRGWAESTGWGLAELSEKTGKAGRLGSTGAVIGLIEETRPEVSLQNCNRANEVSVSTGVEKGEQRPCGVN